MAVVGAGTMGPGIALAFALGGWQVDLIGRSDRRREHAEGRIEESLSRFVSLGRLSRDQADRAAQRITWRTGLVGEVADWDLVIESINEDLAEKITLLKRLEEMVADDTILASNTSSLSIDELSEPLRRPERALGFHWLNPPEFVNLVEIVVGKDTETDVTDRVLGWARAIGKTPVRVARDAPGFIVNRLQYALLREAFSLVESGIASVEDVDAAITAGLGTRWAVVGPFQGLDLGGLDVYAAVAPRLYPELSVTEDASPIATELVAEGAFGCKTGRGTRGEYSERDAADLIGYRDEMLVNINRLRGS